LRFDPRSAAAYFDRGNAYFRLRQFDRAIDDYDQSLKFDPGLSDALARRGNAWLMKGNFDRAWDDYNRAIEVDPKNPYGYVCRGAAAASRFAFDEAIADYNEAIRIDPTYNAAYRYREKAERRKSAIWRGEVYLALEGVAVLALLFGAFRSYRSPTAFSHSVERHFRQMPDGRLIFYPTLRGIGYLVPDAEKEQALRVFSRHFSAVGLVLGIVVMAVGVALMPITLPLISWLARIARLPMVSVIALWSIAQVSGILAGLFAGLRHWRRGATRGLAVVAEKGERPPADQWVDDFVQDMPVAVRWIVLAAIVFLFVGCARQALDGADRENVVYGLARRCDATLWALLLRMDVAICSPKASSSQRAISFAPPAL
jgi:hypothetical protein